MLGETERKLQDPIILPPLHQGHCQALVTAIPACPFLTINLPVSQEASPEELAAPPPAAKAEPYLYL